MFMVHLLVNFILSIDETCGNLISAWNIVSLENSKNCILYILIWVFLKFSNSLKAFSRINHELDGVFIYEVKWELNI